MGGRVSIGDFIYKHGRCTCIEKIKSLSDRDLTVRSYYPGKVWGRARKGYDGRKLLIVACNRCRHTWKVYDRRSPLWRIIDDDPYHGPEKLYVKEKEDE